VASILNAFQGACSTRNVAQRLHVACGMCTTNPIDGWLSFSAN